MDSKESSYKSEKRKLKRKAAGKKKSRQKRDFKCLKKVFSTK